MPEATPKASDPLDVAADEDQSTDNSMSVAGEAPEPVAATAAVLSGEVSPAETVTEATVPVETATEEFSATVNVETKSAEINSGESDGLGLPEGVIPRSATFPISQADLGGYMPGELVLSLDGSAQRGLSRLTRGFAAVEGRRVDHAAVIRRVLAAFAD